MICSMGQLALDCVEHTLYWFMQVRYLGIIRCFLILSPPLRHYVISHYPQLCHLDDSAVTPEEREEAGRVYGRRRAKPMTTSTDSTYVSCSFTKQLFCVGSQ